MTSIFEADTLNFKGGILDEFGVRAMMNRGYKIVRGCGERSIHTNTQMKITNGYAQQQRIRWW